MIASLVALALLAAAYVYYEYNGDISAAFGVTVTNPNATQGTPQPVDLSGKIQQWAQAIAAAEGFGIPGAVPTTHHNPGDLGPGDTGFPGEWHSGSEVSQLPDDATGWTMLTRKLVNIVNGNSSVYNINMTFTQFAQHYAGDWQNWANNVASHLGVSPSSRISDWLFS